MNTNIIHILHLQLYPAILVKKGIMRAIDGVKMIIRQMYAYIISKLYKATASISTHTAFSAISIIISHAKMIALQFVQQHQSVGADTKMTVAYKFYLCLRQIIIL